jgi:hypothetical protein
MDNKIYIIPSNKDKAIKIILEDIHPCPIDNKILCEYSQFKELEELILSYICNNINNCKHFYFENME